MREFEQRIEDREAERGNSTIGEGELSFCSIQMGNDVFGIDTAMVREVLGRTNRRSRREVATSVQVRRDLRPVPLAPAYVAGIIPYRGDVLTTLGLRSLLGDESGIAEGCVLVLDDAETGEKFGLMVDAVNGVVSVREEMREANPCTLNARSRALFDGVYKMPGGLMVKIDPARLSPGKLAESGAFDQRGGVMCVR